jgi:hypothetical protein
MLFACDGPGDSEDPPPPSDPGPTEPDPLVDGPAFGPDSYLFNPPRPVVEEPGEGWCTMQPTANQGMDPIPQTGLDLLQSGLTIDPALVTCPDGTFETWPPFVRRHTATYTATRRWGGFNECVPQIDLEGRYDGVYITHTPLVTANYGVLRYGDILRGLYQDDGWTTDPVVSTECPDPVQNVLDQAEWLDAHAVSRPFEGVDTWAWEYDFVNIQGELEAPWTSAYAQAVASAAYMAAYCVSDNDERWLRGAEKALLNMLVPMRHGGTATWENETSLWLEEASADEAFSARSLNGHLGTLAAIWSVSEWSNSPDIATLVDYGVNAPLNEIERYDAEFISLYTQWAVDYPFIAPKHDYNRFHVQQLSWLYELTGDARALDTAMRFSRYDDQGMEVDLSVRQFGTEEFWHQWVYHPQWWTVAPGWMDIDLGRDQIIDRVILWSPDPEMIHTDDVLRPARVDVDTSMNGVFWDVRSFEWPDQCNDGVFDLEPTEARHVKVWLHSPNREEQPFVGLQAMGIRRLSGHPTGVAQWPLHANWNRPAMAFSEEGLAFNRIGWYQFDLHDSFPGGFEVLFEGWRGPTDPIPMEPWPTVSVSNELDGPWVALDATPRMLGPHLAYQHPGDVGYRYLKVEIDVRFNPLAPGKLFIRSL